MPTRKQLHILLVDDDPRDVESVCNYLRANNGRVYDFTICTDADEALNFLAENTPDCMILDMQRNTAEGYNLLTRLHALHGFIPLPTLVLTTQEDTDGATRALALGAQEYLSRDELNPTRLQRAVNHSLDRFRLVQTLRESEEECRLATETAQLGTWSYDHTTDHFDCHGRGLEMLRLPAGARFTLTSFLEALHEEDRAHAHDNLLAALEPATTAPDFRGEYRLRATGSKPVWLSIRGQVQTTRTGTRLIGTLLDITERKSAEAEREEELQTLDAIYRLGQAFASNMSQEAPMQLATDIATELTKAQFGAFFYNVKKPSGELYTLYAISGVPREMFSQFPMPRNTSLLGETKAVRAADIRTDARYGKNAPHHGMPKGHLPVVSYMAVPVISKGGEVLGTLFFGHREANQFSERAERIAKAIATQAAIGIENIRLIQAMRSGEQRWRNLAEAMPQLVWMARHIDGSCEYLNNQWRDYTGIPTEQLLGYEWLKLLHPDDQKLCAETWKQALEESSDFNVEYRIRRHDGVYRWFKTRGTPIRDEEGKVVVWYGTCTDIQELAESRDEARAASIAKSEFLANMSHEIRTPMNAVIGLANILSYSRPLTPKQQEFINTLQLSASALLDLINDLLDIAKIEAHTVDLEETAFCLHRLAEDVISMMSLKANEKHIRLELETHDALDRLHFTGDAARLRQILTNLVGNALKFTETGYVRVILSCQPMAKEGYDLLRIDVHDTGIGIAPQQLNTIFEKFMQADSSINRKYGGTGLGLAITKTLAELMNGTIEVESVLGQGSVFRVSIPAKRTDAAGDAPLTEMPESASPSTRRPLVLLVEDYAPNVMVASAFLEQFGYDCDVASNGTEAISMMQTGRYRLILMDVQMHGMNGLVATQHIRQYEQEKQLPPLPIIGMTAHALSGDRDVCLQAGMTDYLAKPFNPDELERKLSLYLQPEAA